ncbi:thioredoxin [Ancylostoma duodenale]|uniref:Peptide-N(4)-(N-acetyl-beta-glucosaminyl)asparagine amidase n=1 Tax=Ancylostoma duodenale TaxID=51022 RepID=A0A0C2CZK4_9BILA|nr:thioredoxin [Ancylostoma duodenale]
MPVQLMRNLSDLQAKINSADANRLFIVDFFADWCGPCRFIAPIFENFSTRFTNATFVKVNVDNSPDISQFYGIRAMPTFVLIKEGREMERIQGANPQALEMAINKYYSSTPANPNAASDEERSFLQQFIPVAEKVKFYTDVVYKTLAVSVIPVEELRLQATDENGVNDFFSWCDSPICESCGNQTPKGAGLSGTPTIEERECGADRVEVYSCQCGQEIRFPRYNDPAKLLETRKGRCGEWANCFALMAAAMDFDVRYIYDVTDHVWIELWIPECDNWVHCDPCENIIDHPLIYEKKLNSRMGTNATPERAKELRRRRVRELVEFLVIGKRPTDGENYGGRTSGDVAWRAARSELGCSAKKDTVITMNQEELANKKFSLEYNCAQDVYTRGTETIKGWSTYANFSGQIQRKQEADWKMAYICRREGESQAEVSWSIDLNDVKAKSFRLQIFGTQVYENGSVVVTVCAGEVCFPMRKDSTEIVIDDVPLGILKISAYFSGGKGDNAFQHAQLFRTPLDSPEAQMKIDIELQ